MHTVTQKGAVVGKFCFVMETGKFWDGGNMMQMSFNMRIEIQIFEAFSCVHCYKFES